jgi:DNA-binding transcriptional ArsR family regulator
MVEYVVQLDAVFNSLADPTRRDILARLQRGELNVSDIARPYAMSLAAISKHLKILEKASLIVKRKAGKERYVALSPEAMKQAVDYLSQYEVLWNERFDALEKMLQEEE